MLFYEFDTLDNFIKNNLISNLDYNTSNKLIPSDLTPIRMFCGQKCLNGRQCQVCQRLLDIANPDKLREYLKKS